MCGLVGGVTASMFNFKEQSVFDTLFLLNSLRGLHGCGLLHLYSEKVKGKDKVFYDIARDPSPSSTFVTSKEYETFMRGDTILVMGHSRHATIGSVKEENCHPFVTDKEEIIGFHNGTIRGAFDKKSDFETDSEALYHNIAEKGLKGALTHVYEKSWTHNGVAYALQYYDRKQHKFFLIRNKERPLWTASVSDCMFWASERLFLEFALLRNGYKKEQMTFREVAVGELVTIDPYKDSIGEIVKFTPDFFTPPKEVWRSSVQTTTGGSTTYYRKGEAYKPHQVNNKPAWWEGRNASTELKYFTLGSKQVSSGRLEHILNAGCAVCGFQWDVEDAVKEKVRLTQGDEVLCKNCEETAEKEFGINPNLNVSITPVEFH